MVQFTTSVCPSVCGRNAVDLLSFVSIIHHKLFQNELKNPYQSKVKKDMLKEQIRCSFCCDHLLTRNHQCRSAETIKPPRKSIEILSQGLLRTGNGVYIPNFRLLRLLVQQIAQPFTNRSISRIIPGHYT